MKLSIAASSVIFLATAAVAAGPTLSLDEAVGIAAAEDFLIEQFRHTSLSREEDAVADARLPDPVMQFGALNFPTDSFDIDQEAMTQLRLSVRQSFPRGDTLLLTSEQRQLDAERFSHVAADRWLAVRRNTEERWLESQYWERHLSILLESEPLFDQLLEVAQSFYAVGRKDQNDVIRAQLEIDRLQERVIRAREMINAERERLAEWVGAANAHRQLPKVVAPLDPPSASSADVDAALTRHPSLKAFNTQVDIAVKAVDLARQAYKPQWGVEVAYGARQGEDAMGKSRPDFLSAAVTMDLPLFAAQRQDRRLAARMHDSSAALSARDNHLRTIRAEVQSLFARLDLLLDQIALYDEAILPQSDQQAETALLGYRAATNDFTELMRAYIGVLDANLTYARITTDRQQTVSRLRYFLPSVDVNEALGHE